jgi:hypothetical protein
MEDTDKYIKTHTIFCFWHSDDLNTMTHLRKVALECLQSVSKCNVELITPSRLNDFIVDGYPLHPAFEYLSDVHKSDYLRMYFMHFHGGAYCDIKQIDHSWINYWNMLENDTNTWVIGYSERPPSPPTYLRPPPFHPA